ncbi:MAG: hypothetical protein WCY32_05475 [Burkholderiaceae bacterium]
MNRTIVRCALVVATLLMAIPVVQAQSVQEGRRALATLCESAPKSVCRVLWSEWRMLSMFLSIIDAKAIERLNDIDADEEDGDKRMLPVTKVVVEVLNAARVCLSVTSDRYGWNDSPYRRPDPKSPLPPDISPAGWLWQRTLTAAWRDTLDSVEEVNRDLRSDSPHKSWVSPYKNDWETRSGRCADFDRLNAQLAALARQPLGQPPDLGIDDAVFMRTAGDMKPLKQWTAEQLPAWPKPFVSDTLAMLKADWARPALDVQQSYCYEAGRKACEDSGMWLLGVLLSRLPKAVSDPQFRTAASVLRVSGRHCFVYGRNQSAVQDIVSTTPRGRMLDYQGFVSMRDAAFSVKGVGGAETYEQAHEGGFLGTYWALRKGGKIMTGDSHCWIANRHLHDPKRFQAIVK